MVKRDGCTTDYNSSDIKCVVDEWVKDKFKDSALKEINGYKARLIKKEEYLFLSSKFEWKLKK